MRKFESNVQYTKYLVNREMAKRFLNGEKMNAETVKKIGFAKIHVFPYSKRNGTVAATLENQVPENIKKERVHKLLSVSKELENNYMNKFIGKVITFLPEIEKDGYIIGHTGNYLLVKVPGTKDDLNKIIKVLLTSNEYPYMKGEIYAEI